MRWLSRLPIRFKAPATVAFLVLVVGAAISAAAYVALRSAMHDQAASRLMALQTQYRETYRTSMATSRTRTVEAAARPELSAYLSAPSPARERAARAALRQPGPTPEGVMQTELRDSAGRVVLAEPGPAAKRDTAFETFDGNQTQSLANLVSSAPLGVAYGRFQRVGDAAVFPIVARIGTPATGFLVIWRRLTTSSQVTQQQIATVLGNDAAVYLVNADGSLWTELGKPVPSAPSPPSFDTVAEYDRPTRGIVLSASGPIEGSPWAFVFEFPAAAVHAPADAFLRTIALIATVCILIGALVALVMTRRLTEPLHRLTKAANAIASGELSTRAHVDRSDELGQLVTSFNTMAAEVEASRTRLESLVAERTRKLRSAEESLVRSEKLALVGQYASSIGHEIRNPLAAMNNAIDGLQIFLPEKSPQVQQCLDILTRQVRLSAKVVTDMLDLSRTSVPERESVEVAACVSAMLQKHPSNGWRSSWTFRQTCHRCSSIPSMRRR